MFKRGLAIGLSFITSLSTFAYAEEIENIIENEITVLEMINEPKTAEDEPENIADMEVFAEPFILMSEQSQELGNIISEDVYTDDMTNNDGKYECENFSSYGEISPSEIVNFNDKTILSFTTVNKEAYVTYSVAGTRVFTNVIAVGYTRDGGKNAVVQYSEDGVTYTTVNSSVYKWKKIGSGGTGANDAGWSDKNQIEVNFAAEEKIKYIRIHKSSETACSKFKLGDITLTSTDPYAPKEDPEVPEGYGAEIDTDTVSDELETQEYLFDNVNFTSYNQTNPNDAVLFTDSSLMSFAETGKEAYLIYKAADGRVFTEVKAENYTRDGGGNAEIYVSSDGWAYTNLNAGWKHVGAGGTGANDAGWSDKNTTENTISVDKNIRFIKVRKSPETASTKFKLGKVSLVTADISKGCVIGDIYQETFDEEMYHVNKSKGITVEDGMFKADAAAELVYKAIIKKSLAKITFTVQNVSEWNGIVEAMDVNGNKINEHIELQKEVNGSDVVVIAELPTSAAYVKVVNASACIYSEITIENDLARGTEWTTVQKGTGSTFSVSLGDNKINELEDGCTVSVNVPVKNAGSMRQDVKVIICVFEGDMMEKMEIADAAISGGEMVNIQGSIELVTVTPDTNVTVFVWSDLQTMIPFGNELYLDKN